MNAIIRLDNVSKSFFSKHGEENKVLKNIYLEVEPGEMVAVTGPSGSGKTTLLNILGFVTGATKGSYYLENRNANTLDKKEIQRIRNSKIGFVVQDFDLIEDINAYDNIGLPLLFNKKISYEDMPSMINNALKKVGMFQYGQERVEYLSGGQKQRIGLARAIVQKPDIILADEPTGALDREATDNVLKLLKEINKQGTTIIIVTHNPIVAEICNREIVLNDGQIMN